MTEVEPYVTVVLNSGISQIEMMGAVVEAFAGAPQDVQQVVDARDDRGRTRRTAGLVQEVRNCLEFCRRVLA